MVKADDEDGYQVTFTVQDSGEYYLVNTGVYRKPPMKAPAWVNSATKIDETETREAVTSGKIGENLSWTIENEVLMISGQGDMPDWENDKDCPWYTERGNIKKIVIGKGITRIGKNAFYYFTIVTDIQIPQSVKSIGERAFSYNLKLTEIEIPSSVDNIDMQAFAFNKS